MKFRNILPILLLIMVSGAYAAEITTLRANSPTIDLKDEFYAITGLEGETCGMGITFLLDNKSFSSKLLGCERDEISSGIWNLKENSLDCGTHTLTAELNKKNEVLDSKSINIQIGNIPSMIITPERPLADNDVTLKLIDNRTGEPLSYTKIQVYNAKDREITKYEYTTDSSGGVKFRIKETGEYRIILEDPMYCGSVSFHAKRIMKVIGPIPKNPMEGELITMVVPPGIGTKILDSSGDIYLKCSTSLGGGLNFTIDDAGDYTLVIGELSSEYWGTNISLHVSEKPTFNVDISPSIATLGKPITLAVTDNGKPVDGAFVDILPPNGMIEPRRTTSAYGNVIYTPISTGKYEITVQKEGYSKAIREFLVSRQLLILIEPDHPIEDEEFAVIVRDSSGVTLSGAKVSVTGNSVLTDDGGKARFKLHAGNYEILVENQDYNPEKKMIDIVGILSIQLYPPQIEPGQSTEVYVFDAKSNKIPAEITVTKPDGTKEIIEGAYTPANAGDYEISASKQGYLPVNTTLRVNPRPLNLTINADGEKLLFNVSSRENPVDGIEISLDTPSGAKDRIITDENGMASWNIIGYGVMRITLNPENSNGNYESRILTQQVLKNDSNLLWLLLIFIPIMAVAILIYGRKLGKNGKDTYKKSERPSLSKI